MNKIIARDTRKISKLYDRGSLFKSEEGEIYILCCPTANEYVAICLADGIRWGEPSKNQSETIEGLICLAKDTTITIDY